jgi:uncharacterized protein (TIGR02145 family)
MKCKGLIIAGFSISIVLSCCKKEKEQEQPITSVVIGNQIWMAQNLNTSTYRNGDVIPQVQNSSTWQSLQTGAWCYYNNDSKVGKTYGKLYNWYAVNDPRGLAPEGWHIPTNDEWNILYDYLGSDNDHAGDKLKEAGTSHWEQSPNYRGGNNSSGFTALPGGIRSTAGTFYRLGQTAYWWTSTENDVNSARSKFMVNSTSSLYGTINDSKKMGYSVRCIKD